MFRLKPQVFNDSSLKRPVYVHLKWRLLFARWSVVKKMFKYWNPQSWTTETDSCERIVW